MYRLTESIATRGRLDAAPIIGPDGNSFASRRGTNKLEYPQYGIGNSLLAVPFYWAGSLATKIVSSETARHLLDFQTQLYVDATGPGRGHELLKRFFVSLTGSLIAAATSALIFLFCARLTWVDKQDYAAAEDRAFKSSSYTRAACWGAAIAYGACTIALPHARTFFSEPLATFFVLLSFYLLYTPQNQLSIARVLAAGTAGALALLTRLDSLFALPGVCLYLFFTLPAVPVKPWPVTGSAGKALQWLREHSGSRNSLYIYAFGAPMLLFAAWYLVMNQLHFGAALTSAYADQPEGIRFSTPLLAGIYGFLLSAGKSIFLFSPAILLGLFGLPLFARRHKRLAAGLILSGLVVLFVHSSWQNWAGGWCWGPRHIFMVHALLMIPGVAWLSQASPLRRISIEIIMLAGFVVQLYGTSQNFIDYYVLYYRTPYTPPYARVLYGPEDLAPSFITATAIAPDGWEVPFPVMALPAPLSDSIYVPQNTQWYRYAEMWNLGYTDNLWLRLVKRATAKEQPII